MASILFSGYACTSDGSNAVSGSGGHSQIASGGSGGFGGTAASGGIVAAGGAPATGGATTSTNVPWGTGGTALDSCSAGYSGNPFCGGNTGSAGATSSAGNTGSAGATGYGGMAGTCGAGNRCDASPGPTRCSCAAGATTWDCYCQAFDCGKTLATYTATGGAKYDVRMEYANCNLVEYWTVGYALLIDVFDLTTGQLVGQTQSNVHCPFDGAESDAA
ncbi:MAG TPA: hypothetical protein VF524_11420, partial [Polyangia bacterium]